MKITLKDGSVKEFAEAMSIYGIAMSISEGLARNACAAELNGEVVDLRTVVSEDATLSILTFDDEAGRKTANLVIFENCKELIRCLPALTFSQRNPNDVATEPHDITHSPDAIRYFVSARPLIFCFPVI